MIEVIFVSPVYKFICMLDFFSFLLFLNTFKTEGCVALASLTFVFGTSLNNVLNKLETLGFTLSTPYVL